MAFAPPVKAKVSSHMAKSTWTPLNNRASNNQVFEERREIMKKWFDKWQDSQKRVVVGDILKSLSHRHLIELHENLNCKFPQENFDFTKILPRVLTLYLFSFLDPRTLCRCAQVSWYWNYLTELDCLWRPKCLKFGWYPTYQPTPFEEKIWKRFYVKTVHELNYAKPKSATAQIKECPSERGIPLQQYKSLDTERSVLMSRGSGGGTLGVRRGPLTQPSNRKPSSSSAKWEPPPWRGSDPNPVDTMRYNVLNNTSKFVKKNPSMIASGKSPHKKSANMNSARSLSTTTMERSKSSTRRSTPRKKLQTPHQTEHAKQIIQQEKESIDLEEKNNLIKGKATMNNNSDEVDNEMKFAKTMKNEELAKEMKKMTTNNDDNEHQVDQSLQGTGWKTAVSDDENF